MPMKESRQDLTNAMLPRQRGRIKQIVVRLMPVIVADHQCC